MLFINIGIWSPKGFSFDRLISFLHVWFCCCVTLVYKWSLYISGVQRCRIPFSSTGFNVLAFTCKPVVYCSLIALLGRDWIKVLQSSLAWWCHIPTSFVEKLLFLHRILLQLCQISVVDKYMHLFWTMSSVQLGYIYILILVLF